MKRWLFGKRVYVSVARRDPRTGSRAYYTRRAKMKGYTDSRTYHVISLARNVSRNGHFWKVIIGPLAIVWGLRSYKGVRK